MHSELPSSLDNLAASGIINFDSEAYIKGTPPRYVGSPNNGYVGLPFEQPLMAFPHGQVPQMHVQPHSDTFVSGEGHKEPSSWKAALAGVLVAGGAVFAGIKYGPGIASKFKKTPATTATPAAATTTTTTATATATAAAANATATKATAATPTGFFGKIKNGFKTVGTKIKDAYKTAAPKVKALPKWAKITGGIVLGLIALTGINKLFSKPQAAPAGAHAPAPAQHH